MSDDENDYGDDFEDEFETSGAASPSKHYIEKNDANKKSHEHHRLHMQLNADSKAQTATNKPTTPRATSSYSDEYNPDDEDDGDEDGKPSLFQQMGGEVDLESYLKNMLSSPVAANQGDEENQDENDKNQGEGGHGNKELQPLVGIQPEDEDQRKLQAKLGYSPDKPLVKPVDPSEFSTATLLSQPHASGMNATSFIQQLREQQQQQANQQRQSYSLAHSSSGGDHVSQLLAMAASSKSPQNTNNSTSGGTNVEDALKVDALLRDLFPDRYKDKETPISSSITSNNKSKGKKKKKKEKPAQLQYHLQQQYGLGAPRLPKPAPYDEEEEENEEEEDDSNYPNMQSNKAPHVRQSSGGDLLGGLETQLKILKKELKAKDEKIQRLTEHAMMVGNQMDKMRGEIARLNARLHEAQMELETKDARLLELHRKKKKESKKKQEQQMIDGSIIGQSSIHGVYEGEIVRLREREQALMDAVEELSSQNEDLIIKLRESMQRELELSSRRAQLVSHTIIGTNSASAASMLPSIHEKHTYVSGQGMLRAQTEPGLISNSSNGGNNNNANYHQQQEFPVKPMGKKKKKHSSG